MFTPIKNFITYIQNAGGSGMFGAVTTPTTTTQILTTSTTTPPTLAITKSINIETPTLPSTIAAKIKLTEIESKMEEENLIKIKLPIPKEHILKVILEKEAENNMPLNTIMTTSTTATTTTTTTTNNINNENVLLFNENNDVDDDIELQIKSNIMVKPSIVNVEKLEKNSNNALRHTRTIMRRPSISGPGPMVKEEPMKFIPPPELGKIVDRDKIHNEIINIPKEIETNKIEVNLPIEEDVLNESFESALEDDSFLEVSLPEIPNSEIIVLNCIETISPTTTATPTEDPLASDNSFNNVDHQNDMNSFNGSSLNSTDEINIEMETTAVVNDDVDAGMVYWLNVETNDIDGCDNNNLSVDNATTSMQANNIILLKNNENTKANIRITTRHEHLEEGRSEGSDSGLGVEASQITKFKGIQLQSHSPLAQHAMPSSTTISSNLTTTNTTTTIKELCTNSSTLLYDSTVVTHLNRLRLRSNLKRQHDVSGLTQTTDTADLIEKRPKRSITFDSVKMYYFSRQQGFNCVPSAGGCTLGMSSQHHSFKTMTLAEHAAELRRAHRMQLQEINPRASSSDDSEESEEDFLSEGSGSDLDAESNGFLQPVTPKQRRALLKAAGVRKIDANEKIECRDIRNSREVCGCTCRDYCDPETCACSQAGIKCQVDRSMFPCGCSRDACGNTVGRIEFNPSRVRTHFIHTIMRLEMENRQQQQPNVINHNNNNNNNNNINSNLNNYTSMSSSHYYNTQNQSNYSSGYASPAYTAENTIGVGSQSPANYYAHQSNEHHHYMIGNREIQHHENNYQNDALDAGLYTTHDTMHVTPTYGDLTNIASYDNNAHYNTTANYAEIVTPRPISPYGSCFMPESNHNHNYTSERNPAPQQQNFSNISHATSSPICTFVCASANTLSSTGTVNSYANDDIIGDSGTASFIDLSSPVANATRLSQINDMLQQNRHTTATLVAVTPNNFPVSTIVSSPPPSPTSSTTISVEHDDTSNISVINNIEDCLNQNQQPMNLVSNSSPPFTRLQTSFPNSKEIDSKEIIASPSSSIIHAVLKEEKLQ